MEIVLIIISIFIFLFVLHYYVRDDFVIFRKNVSLEDVFNMAFISFIFVFLSSRFFYVLENPNPIYLNPLVFLAVFYHKGLSLTGGIIGGGLFLVWYVRKNKFPGKRLLDFFSVAAVWAIGIYSVVYLVVFRKFTPQFLIEGVLFAILLAIFSLLLVPKYLGAKIKDGLLTGIFCVGYSLIKFVNLLMLKQFSPEKLSETTLLIIIFFSGLIFILKEFSPKIKDLK
ncbi:MAG: prolipoprotein diacylglyceryl transferase family protein [Patescibacteria group bacterium]